MSSDAVSLRRGDAGPMARLATEKARAVTPHGRPPEVTCAAQVAADLGPWLPTPTRGDTLTLWEALASLGAVDLTVARVAEPHLDALAILREARHQGQIHEQTWDEHSPAWNKADLWQVYAAEGSERLHAVQRDGAWTLTGVKPWCSLADLASHALITAWDGEQRRLFAVDLTRDEVEPADGLTASGQSTTWVARGLAGVRSTALRMNDVPAVPIGDPGWYLTRPGFAWGGAGVATIWYGATVALARRLREASRRREPDQVALMQLGAVDTALARTRALLADAAAVADTADAEVDEMLLVTQRVRQCVADTAEEVLQRVGHALGPAPLTGDEDHARRVADLTVYLRQHHAERDLARQGGMALEQEHGWTW
ncbi:MAG TPA: acyl-CoA dehydrogenase [Nocardioides sp.]|nr:acyl-CoA dehydrogenase [Nocardioides sp.]